MDFNRGRCWEANRVICRTFERFCRGSGYPSGIWLCSLQGFIKPSVQQALRIWVPFGRRGGNLGLGIFPRIARPRVVLYLPLFVPLQSYASGQLRQPSFPKGSAPKRGHRYRKDAPHKMQLGNQVR